MAGFEVTPYGRFCLTPEGFAARSLFAAAALLALSALLACLLPVTPSPSHQPKLSAMNKACPI